MPGRAWWAGIVTAGVVGAAGATGAVVWHGDDTGSRCAQADQAYEEFRAGSDAANAELTRLSRPRGATEPSAAAFAPHDWRTTLGTTAEIAAARHAWDLVTTRRAHTVTGNPGCFDPGEVAKAQTYLDDPPK